MNLQKQMLIFLSKNLYGSNTFLRYFYNMVLRFFLFKLVIRELSRKHFYSLKYQNRNFVLCTVSSHTELPNIFCKVCLFNSFQPSEWSQEKINIFFNQFKFFHTIKSSKKIQNHGIQNTFLELKNIHMCAHIWSMCGYIQKIERSMGCLEEK